MEISQIFAHWLVAQKQYQKNTVKNYLSDFRHFWGWLVIKLQAQGKLAAIFGKTKSAKNPIEIISQITPALLEAYKEYLFANKISKTTIKRRLAVVRLFCQFAQEQNWLTDNPAQNLVNRPTPNTPDKLIHDITSQFGFYLKHKGVAKNTIKNYVADVRAFLETQIK